MRRVRNTEQDGTTAMMMNLEVRRLTKRGERKYHPHTAPWRLPTGHGQKIYIYITEDIASGNVRSHKSKGLSSDM